MLQIKDGHVFIINERERLTDIIERNSLFRLGTFIPYNFKHLADVPIPSASIDLVVCYMGMHHLPQEQISIFLKMIYRILRPNGLFLFRDHHAYEELIPLLDVAHMVFNVVTSVDYESEINEIRAFRTIEQWRSCLRQAGFEDTFIYDEQDDDPTDDIMIVFRKPIQENLNVHNDLNEIVENGIYDRISAIPESNYFRPCEWFVVRICMEFGQYLNHTPFHKFPYMKFLSHYWSLFYIETDLVVQKFGIKAAIVASPGFVMNGFIGILLSISFLQMAFISFLILTFSGETKPEYEQLILEQTEEIDNNNFNFQESIDHRIDNVQVLKEQICYAVRVPRHHVYTSILKKLALHRAKFNLLRISNLDGQIQIELTINNNDEQRLLWLKQNSNTNIIFEYKNPNNIKKTHLIIAVKIKYLFVFLRDCANFEADHSLTIVQIFDHFDWYLPE
jgi:SAM-dependent methyltransferase